MAKKQKKGTQNGKDEKEVTTVDLFEKALALVEEYKSLETRGRPMVILEHGLEEPVIGWLLAGWSGRAISREIKRRYGIDINFDTINRFRRAFIDPIKELPEDLKRRIKRLGDALNVLDELAEIHEEIKEREEAVRELEKSTIPTDLGTQIIDQRMRLLELYHKIEERELGIAKKALQIEQSEDGTTTTVFWDDDSINRYVVALEKATGKPVFGGPKGMERTQGKDQGEVS